MSKIEIFKENKMLGGYLLAVRDDWSFKIKRVSISEEEKHAYEQSFGSKIITYSDFFNWWRVLSEESNTKINSHV